MNKTICVIGAGYWGKNHIRVLNDLGVLGGIVEEDTAVIKEVSRNYPKRSEAHKASLNKD